MSTNKSSKYRQSELSAVPIRNIQTLPCNERRVDQAENTYLKHREYIHFFSKCTLNIIRNTTYQAKKESFKKIPKTGKHSYCGSTI